LDKRDGDDSFTEEMTLDNYGELLERIQHVRKKLHVDYGLLAPPVRVIDNLRLKPAEYRIMLNNTEYARAELMTDRFLCIKPVAAKPDEVITVEISGIKTIEPSFGLSALWIKADTANEAHLAGYTVVDLPRVIATHVEETITSNAAVLLNRQSVMELLSKVEETHPAVVEAAKVQLNPGEIKQILAGLLQENVSIRDMVTILDSLADNAAISKERQFLIERTRQALGREICLQNADDDNILHVFTLDESWEKKIIESAVDTGVGKQAVLEPETHNQLCKIVEEQKKAAGDQGYPLVILCSEQARPLVRQALKRDFPEIAIISVCELQDDIEMKTLGRIGYDDGHAAV
jgi:flagellar biosynthesis protein FlhA